MRSFSIQMYPRKSDNMFDEDSVKPHSHNLSSDELREIVEYAIHHANIKSSRVILDVSDDQSSDMILIKKAGVELFKYFKKYVSDPAATAHQCYGRHYADVAKEQFRNRTLQKERMNSGWRYQYIAERAAQKSLRFTSVSGIGTQEADFNVVLDYKERKGNLNIYVSVKNRVNTMGGQDWPKAISAMESIAIGDKNRTGDFLCVFGIAMDRGGRIIKKHGTTKQPFSNNTEIWKSDFFWPFFTNCSYHEIVKSVLTVLIETQKPETLDLPIPDALVDSFGDCCNKAELLDSEGRFNDPYKLVSLFCGGKS